VYVKDVDMTTTISRASGLRIACAGHSVQMAGSGDRTSAQPEVGCLSHRRGARVAAEPVPYVGDKAVLDELLGDLAVTPCAPRGGDACEVILSD
jgi:hypothetical protein